MRVLVVDVGGTNVKILATGQDTPRRCPYGPQLTPSQMVADEDYLGARALRRLGRKKWRKYVEIGVTRMIEALHPDDVVLGAGNAKRLKTLPEGCRAGDNANAFAGGFRLWDNGSPRRSAARKRIA